MTLWFVVIAALGVVQIAKSPRKFCGRSVPHYALDFMVANPKVSFILLGAVVLCVTGSEALYADMGHFGKQPIRLAWFSVAMPALHAQLFWSGRLVAGRPPSGQKPVLHVGARSGCWCPWCRWLLAAAAIASQALITGAFSVTKQVIQLGYLPRLRVRAHQRAGNGTNLLALCELEFVRRHCVGGGAVRSQQLGGGVWHCRDAGHAHHHHPHVFCAALPLALSVVAVLGRYGAFLSGGSGIFQLQHAQAAAWGLVSVGDCR